MSNFLDVKSEMVMKMQNELFDQAKNYRSIEERYTSEMQSIKRAFIDEYANSLLSNKSFGAKLNEWEESFLANYEVYSKERENEVLNRDCSCDTANCVCSGGNKNK